MFDQLFKIAMVLMIYGSLAMGVQADVFKTPEGKLTLNLAGVPVVDALNMIAEQNHLNLVVSGELQGSVTLRLEEVDVTTAFDAILTSLGYAYYFSGNVIVVKSADVDVAAELESRTVRLKYLDPLSAQKALGPRLSDKGKVVILSPQVEEQSQDKGFKPNRIVITDRPNNIEPLMTLLSQLDLPDRMVLIEVKIIETKVDNATKLGFQWPLSLGVQATGAGSASSTTGTVATASDNDNNLAVRDLQSGTWTWGKLNVNEVSVVLDALLRNGNSKLLSDPRVTTAENYQAEIATQTVIPIQTINRFSEGAVIQDIVTFQDEEVGIRVTVLPRINEDGRITMDVNPVIEDIIGFTGPPESQKPITTSRSIKTRVTVDDGETLALGGLLKEDEIITTHRVPLLGQIPLLGKLLFTHKSTEKSTTDLIILITPHIL